ncbi:hypothetical protein FHY31_000558 [Xanthomonas euvesicatoria]|uniref:Uncharacterized protein n=1 Tax=Xanthomonas euvesicatoria TaxID=456327 RepID=A0AAW3U066_XANEU|nr:hypothetical protein [Xanthomonas euvesicatoria]MBB4868853.1 hypothetical protein [Xanthomonas euvesicatoria]
MVLAEFDRRQLAKAVMRCLNVLVGQPLLCVFTHFSQIAGDVHIQHATSEAAIERSMKPFCIGRSGAMKSNAMFLRSAHSANANAMNSGPLSRQSFAG